MFDTLLRFLWKRLNTLQHFGDSAQMATATW